MGARAHERYEIHCAPKDPYALAGAMWRIMRISEEDPIAMGRTGRSRILRHFDMDANAGEWEALYCSLLNDCRQQSHGTARDNLMSEF